MCPPRMIPPNPCTGWKPIYITSHDLSVMSQQTKDAIRVHDDYGEKVCGWKAPGK